MYAMRFLIMAERTARLEEAAPSGDWVETPPGTLDTAGRLKIRETIAAMTTDVPTLIVTDRDLACAETSQLFGFADHVRQVAIVSAFRLDDGNGALPRRLQNAIAHECGHLRGLRHCRNPECLMHPSTAASDLDVRSATACGKCPQRRNWVTSLFKHRLFRHRWINLAAAILSMALLVAGTQAMLRLVFPDFDAPFS